MVARKCACGKCGCTRPPIINRVVLVLDESGSMSGIKSKTLQTVSDWIDKLKQESKKFNQLTYLSVFKFGSRVTTLFSTQNINYVPPKLDNYSPGSGGQTALYDGIQEAIDNVSVLSNNESVLVIVITDGEENFSHRTTSGQLGKTMKALEATTRWTFTFAMPQNCVAPFKHIFPSLSSDNIQAWETTEKGTEDLCIKTSGGISAFYNARSMGHTQVKNFYSDMSRVTPSVLNRQLTDVTYEYEVFDVAKEDRILEFVERKTRRPYAKGEAFYELMKKEKIGAKKEICIMDKKSGKIWSGTKARELIGLQNGVDAKVDPLNHGAFVVFIESRSTNRILPRGTKIIVKKHSIY